MTFEEHKPGDVLYLHQEPQKIVSMRKKGKFLIVTTRNAEGKETERNYEAHTDLTGVWSVMAPSTEKGVKRGGLLSKHLKKESDVPVESPATVLTKE